MYVVPWSVPVRGWIGSILILLSLKACMFSGSCLLSSCTKDLKAAFLLCCSVFIFICLSVCCLLIQYGTFLNCVTHTLVVFVFFLSFSFFESSGVVTLSWFKAPSGFRFLLFLWRLSRGCPIYIWPTKPKLLYEWTLSAHLQLPRKIVKRNKKSKWHADTLCG